MKMGNLILLILFVLVSCKSRNKLHTDEQQLINQIIQEEEEKEVANKQPLAEEGSDGSNTIRLEEDRSINQQQPPIVLDIPSARESVKSVKYSELGNSIRYVYLKHPTDSAFFKHGARVVFSKNNIIVTTWRGIGRFDLHGQFIEMICNDGQKFEVHSSGHKFVSPELRENYVGSQGNVFVIGDRVFYQYVDNPNSEAYLLEYDVSPGKQALIMPGYDEDKRMNGKGKIISRLPVSKKGKMTSTFQFFGNRLTLLDEEHWFVNKGKFQSSKTGDFIRVHSMSGDTVCTLKDHDPVENFGHSTYRGVESGDNYKLNGYRYFRQDFNDTIYRFEGANRLVPMFVINLGEKGLQSSTDAITPSIDLAEKFVYCGTVETDKFLFFMYTQDYSCPNTAKRGTLKFNRFVFNKNTGEKFHAYIDAEPYMPNKKMTWPRSPQKNIVNDLDFGPARWPENLTETGKIYFQVSGKELKEHIQKNKKSTISTNRNKLEILAENCNGDDVVLMIIE